ncbi:MAG: Cap15 family cyclic dinucleotide receptor domain-containing protein [Telluria sp.]
MKNLNGQRFALAIFVVFALSFAGLYFGSAGAKNTLAVLQTAYKAVPVVVFVAGIFAKFGWRLRVFRGWLVPFPDLNGTWEGTLQTTWRDPETGNIPGPIPAILTVQQTFTRISCVIRTDEMTSRSYLADFWLDENEQIRMLGYSYHSKPKATVQHRSAQHDGTMVLELIGNPVEKLKGQYWTMRKTTGEAIFVFRQKERLEEMPSELGPHPMSAR